VRIGRRVEGNTEGKDAVVGGELRLLVVLTVTTVCRGDHASATLFSEQQP
jgi:hypothetical protein